MRFQGVDRILSFRVLQSGKASLMNDLSLPFRNGGHVFRDVTFYPKIGPVETEQIGLQFDEERACQTMRSGSPKGYFLVQNRAEWKQLVAGAAHLCKERVPEYLG